MVAFNQLKRKGDKGAWYNTSESFLNEIKEADPSFPDKFQGLDNVRLYLESKPELTDFLCKKYASALS